MSLTTLNDVFVEQLKDVYSAEKQLVEALPKVAKAAANPELRRAFEDHLAQTRQQMDSVQALLQEMDENPGNKKCKGMAGLIEEGSEVIKSEGDAAARDAALIVAAQKVEHYEIASYGSLRKFAETLGYDEAAKVLQDILDQEHIADQTLDNLAMGINQKSSINEAALS
jgi:ferritin-like metal-binding protein YciE